MHPELHWTRRFYRRYLDRYGWARRLKGFVVQAWFWYLQIRFGIRWRTLYCIHLIKLAITRYAPVNSGIADRHSFLSALLTRIWQRAAKRIGRSLFSLQPLAAYRRSVHLRVFMLAPAESVELQMPEIWPASYRDRFHRQSWQTRIPAVEAVEVPEAEIMGRCEFFFARQAAIHHDLYDFGVDLPGEEMHGLVGIEEKRGLLVRYAKGRANTCIEEAISLLGWSTHNYIHWLTEYLPKLSLVDDIPSLTDLPLAIDAGLHPNILESLRLCNAHDRNLITVGQGEVLQLKRAIFITPTAYAPFDYRVLPRLTRNAMMPERAMFVPRAIRTLRAKLLSAVAEEGRSEDPCRLFFRRNSHYRRMQNAEEVENLLRAHGFLIVEPERLSFMEQMKLVSAAEIIVTQSGAALGNMLFAPEGCRVVILTTWSPYSDYHYFSNLASVLNLRCIYIMCDCAGTEAGIHPAHRSPVADLKLLEEVIHQ